MLRHVRDADEFDIDCPLGWPDTFVEFLCTHRDQREHSIDRVGSGLRGSQVLGAHHQRYKALHLGQYEEDCRRSDHVFDAVVSAVLARAAALGRTIPPDDLAVAGREGWIALPTCALSDLVGT